MLKLNLLPGSGSKGGSVKAATFMVLLIWLALLVGLALWAFSIKKGVQKSIDEAQSRSGETAQVDTLTNAMNDYNTADAALKPESMFFDQVMKQPGQIVAIMREIARATPRGVVIKSFQLAPDGSSIVLNAFARDYAAADRWRLDLYTDPDFTDVQFPSLAGGGTCNGQQSAGGGMGGGYPGMGGGGGYPGMGGRGPMVGGVSGAGGKMSAMMGGGGPSGFGGRGGASGGGQGSGNFTIPCQLFPDGRNLQVTVTIKDPYPLPTFPPPQAAPADTSGGMGDMGGGYPGMPGGGGYPGMGGGGYPGAGGGYPGMPPSSGTTGGGGKTAAA